MKPVVIGNWKMNGRRQRIDALVDDLVNGLPAPTLAGVEVVLCPPAIYLHRVAVRVRNARFGIGAQDVHWAPDGAVTGALSAGMLVDNWVTHVIVGHSERRLGFGETDVDVARKARAALDAGLRVVLCVGEQAEQRSTGRAFETVLGQIDRSLAGIETAQVDRLLLAYEPVWAIGTGSTATEEDVAAMHARIRNQLVGRFETAGQQVPILYGGSVKVDNAAALAAEMNVDGLLVGGASLDAGSFIPICTQVIQTS